MTQYYSQFQNRDNDSNYLLNSHTKYVQQQPVKYTIAKPLHMKINSKNSHQMILNSSNPELNQLNKCTYQYSYHNMWNSNKNNRIDITKNRKLKCMEISRSMNKNWETLIDMLDYYEQNATSIQKRLKCFSSLTKILNFLKLMLQRPEYQCMIQEQQNIECKQQIQFGLNIIIDRYEYELRQKDQELKQLEIRIFKNQNEIDEMEKRRNEILEAEIKIKKFYSDYEQKQEYIKSLEMQLQYYKNLVKYPSQQQISNNQLKGYKQKESRYIYPINYDQIYKQNNLSDSSSQVVSNQQYIQQQYNVFSQIQLKKNVKMCDIDTNTQRKLNFTDILEYLILPIKKQIRQMSTQSEQKILKKHRFLNISICNEELLNRRKVTIKNYRSIIKMNLQLINMIWKLLFKSFKKIMNKKEQDKIQKCQFDLNQIKSKIEAFSVKFYDKYQFYKQNITLNDSQFFIESTKQLRQVWDILNNLFEQLYHLT